MKPIRLSIALLTAWMLAMALGSCNKSNPDPVPPACPPDPKPVVKTEGPVRFEFGVTDLDGNPKNCFRKGESFRVYLYIINQQEIPLYNNWSCSDTTVPEIIANQESNQLPTYIYSRQCRGLSGHYIYPFDTLIIDVSKSYELAAISEGRAPYPNYHLKRQCRSSSLRMFPSSGLDRGMYQITLPYTEFCMTVAQTISTDPLLYVAPAGSSYDLYTFSATLPLVVQ